MKIRAQGFTLIELMTAILVMAILAGIAVPSFRAFALNSRISAAHSDLVVALNYARSEAIHRSSLVQVCSSTTLASCSGSTTWTNGWIVFADANGNGTVDANELLQTWAPVQGNVTVTADVASAVYTSQGMARLPGNAATGTFTSTHASCRGGNARRSVLSISGSLQTNRTTATCP